MLRPAPTLTMAVAALALSAALGSAARRGQADPPALAAADAAMAAGRFADAARQYETWLEAQPQAAPVLLALGACYIQLGRAPQAAAVLRRHLAVQPRSAQGRALLGVALLDAADTSAARAELDAALAIDPALPAAIEARARLALIDDAPADAIALLRRVPAPGADLRLLLAEAHLRAGDAAAAAAALDRELAGESPPVPAYVLAAYAQIKAGELARAAAIAEAGMRRYPDSEIESVYLTLPPPVLAERTARRLKALQAATAPDVSELVSLARVLIDVDPTRKTRALAIARTLVAQALAIDPANASAQHQHARILREHDIPASIEAWTKALALRPSDELALQIHTQLAKARQAVSDAPGADAAFAAALAVNRRLPQRVPEPALEYVRFLSDEGRTAEADALLAEVIGWNPWSPVARAERARQYDAAEDWPRVVTEGEFVLRTAGDHDDLRRVAHLLLAKAYYRLKQPEKARVHADWLKGRP